MEGERLQRTALTANPAGQGLVLVTMALTALGVVMVYSTSAPFAGRLPWYLRPDVRQAAFAAVGILGLAVFWRIDYRWLARRPWPETWLLRHVPSPATMLLAVGLITSAAVLIPGVGYAVGGFKRWFRLGPVGFQPSEILKIGVLVSLAAMLSRPNQAGKGKLRVLAAILLALGAVALVVTQDFGTAAILAASAGAVMLMAGVPWYVLAGMIPPAAAGFYVFVVRSPHRWGRILAMLEPFNVHNPATYQPRQSLIAIASGGLLPAGVGGGVAKYGYLPEDSTDFVFSIICEELGVFGPVLVAGLLAAWLLLAWRAATRSGDPFGALLAGGLGFLVGLQAALHLAVTVVWAPPTGVSMPFVSAGGSSLLVMCAATALVVSVSARGAPPGSVPLGSDA